MLNDFIATIAVGVVAGGVMLVVRHLSGWRLAKWMVPAAIGLGMIGYSIWNEYSWFGRVKAQLPATVVVASAPEQQIFYRPWTFAFPIVDRFLAVDRGAGAEGTGPFAGQALIVQRWVPTQRVAVAFDCGKGARADLIEGATLGPDGALNGGIHAASLLCSFRATQ